MQSTKKSKPVKPKPRKQDHQQVSPQTGSPPAPPWPDPVPLAAAPTAEPFPLAVLPAPMRQFVEEGAQACSCPPDYLAVPALALAGAAIGNARVLRIKHGYEVGTNLYTAIIGSPGSRKSPALELVAKPFYAKDYQVEADWRQKNLNLPEADRKPRQNIYVKDVTTEKLAECLRDSPRGLVATVYPSVTQLSRSLRPNRGHSLN